MAANGIYLQRTELGTSSTGDVGAENRPHDAGTSDKGAKTEDLVQGSQSTSGICTLQEENVNVGSPPDGGYGWVNVICVFFQNSVTWGLNSIFGVYLSFYLENDFFAGVTTLHFAFVGGLTISVGLIIAPIVNYLSKRWSFKVPMSIGVIFLSLGQIFAGLSSEIWQLFLTQGLMFGFGLGLIFIPALPIVQQWFTRRRAQAAGISSMGSGFGALLFSTTTRIAIERHSLQFAFVMNGLISLIVMVPVIILMKGRVKVLRAKFEPLQFSFFLRPNFTLIIGWGIINAFGYYISLFSMSTFTVAGLGRTQGDGSTVTSVLAAGQLIGRPILGTLLDYGGRINIACVATFIAGLSCLLIWMFTRTYALLIFFAAVQGFFGGIFWGSSVPVCAEVVGIQDLGSACSLMWVAVGFPSIFSQVIALSLIEYSRTSLHRTHSDAYLITIGFAGGCFFMGSIFLLFAKFKTQASYKLFKKT